MTTATNSLLTNTALDRSRRREDSRSEPALFVVGRSDVGPPANFERVLPFKRTLAVGRRPDDFSDADRLWSVKDNLVSRVHFRISKVDDGWEVADLGSRNGTAVDGALLPRDSPMRIKDGAILCFGSYVAVFRLVADAALTAIKQELTQPFGPVSSASPELAVVSGKLAKLARSAGEILLTGETGSGKEVYAQAIHKASGRTGRFVAVNCAAIPRELIESELFGYSRGAHSEAKSDKRGLFEEAEGGTLLLDEIGDMPQNLQAKLLRFLQDRVITPLGSTRHRKVDVRVIAATSRSAAPSSPESAGLRIDLAARLGAEPIRLPPLRHRIEDVGSLSKALLDSKWKPFENMAFQALCLHNWPGNVRELAKVLETASALAVDDETIAIEHLPATIAQTPERLRYTPQGASGRPAPSASELESLLRRFSGNVTRVARELDRKSPLIYRWCRRYNLDPDAFRRRD